ncbi:transcription factor 25-like isoform X2 [Actinia tenebrosa]|uniref:Transcription factor 25-like isoform X2 n=1 Tax=Actinia tenebrosa TaxID=6105 RepID=A0A6P8IT37_ACTTE|nr:transcription factor 25-like isoform X2 [Actinia tenebrosa]
MWPLINATWLNEGNDVSSDEPEENEESQTTEEKQEPEEKERLENDTVSPASSQKKKKKKKRKGKGNKGEQEQRNANKDEEDIDATIREVNDMLGITQTLTVTDNAATTESTSSVLDTKGLLGVENRNLNAENEMKKRFGSNIVRNESRQKRAHRRVYQRSSLLVTPKETWPNMSKSGLSMSLVESKNGFNYFVFEHSQAYQKIQFLFLDAVESLDPNNISAILHSHPFHIDSLLQLSEICKMGEDYQMAADLVERALYCFECSFHTLFSLSQGTSRLDYSRAENRPFFIALFRQLIFVGQKGCHRTALELCKLLLSLDPENDPLCTLLMIDFYAVTSDQYSYLVRMYDEWESHRNLSQLPNFALSVPLALFHLSKDKDDTRRADEMLQNSLIMFPSVLVPLMDKCGVSLDPSIASHKFYFVDAKTSESIALHQLVMLYVGRTHHVWKDPQVIDWLVGNARKVLQRVDTKDPYVQDCARKRAIRYRGTPRSIYRHIIMSDIKDATASLPMDLQDVPLMSYDPLPPADSVSSYSRPQRPTRRTEEHSPLSLFFRSLLPSYNAQAPNDPEYFRPGDRQVAQEVEGAEGGPRPLRGGSDIGQSVETLMTAMRVLLTSISFRGEPGEEENGEEEQDWNDNEGNRPQ